MKSVCSERDWRTATPMSSHLSVLVDGCGGVSERKSVLLGPPLKVGPSTLPQLVEAVSVEHQ